MGKKVVKLKKSAKTSAKAAQEASDVPNTHLPGKSHLRFARAGRDPFSPERFIQKQRTPRKVEIRPSPMKLRGRVQMLNNAASNAVSQTILGTARRGNCLLCPTNLALFRIAENMVSEASDKFSEVAVSWQRKVKTMEGDELETTHSKLREIEALVKAHMAVISREETLDRSGSSTTATSKDYRAMTVICQSLFFTIPFQLQKLLSAMGDAIHDQEHEPDAIDWEKMRGLARNLADISGHFSAILQPSVPALYVPTGKFRTAQDLEKVKDFGESRTVQLEASSLHNLQKSETLSNNQPTGLSRVRRAPLKRIFRQ